MSALQWQRGTLYPTGSVVRPTASEAGGAGALVTLANPGFESGATGWTLTGGFAVVNDPANSFSGAQHARLNGINPAAAARNNTIFPVTPGQTVRASCMIRVNAADQVGGAVVIVWRNAGGTDLGFAEGSQVNVLSSGYRQSTVVGTAPAGAASFQVAIFAFALQAGTVRADAFVVDYQAPATAGGLVFRAVQPAVGTSGPTEPTWPATAGLTVVDGTVTWEAFNASTVVWEAKPIMVTGAGEPDWPTVPGGSITDGDGIAWVATTREVKDARCPQSRVVAIGATKVFAADGDVVRYSASGNPLDWSTAEDAGFLPTGLQQNGGNRLDVLNLYRSNLVAFNASTFQMWQIDPDPEQMALLDAMEGIGSIAQKAAQPVGNDLFFLTTLGVRTVGIAAGSTNLQAGDVGMPIDPLIQEAVAGQGATTLSCYYPAAGQYWLIPRAAPPPPVATPSIAFAGTAWLNTGGIYAAIDAGVSTASAVATLSSSISQDVQDFRAVLGVVPGVASIRNAGPGEPITDFIAAYYIPNGAQREYAVVPPQAEPIIGATLSVTEARVVEIDGCGGPLTAVTSQVIPTEFGVLYSSPGVLSISYDPGEFAPSFTIGSFLIRVTGTVTTASGVHAVDFLIDNVWNFCV